MISFRIQRRRNIDDSAQDCDNSITNALELPQSWAKLSIHYDDAIMGTMASQITSLTIVYSTVHLGVDQSRHQSSASLAFVRGIHRGPVNSPHKGSVTRKMFPFDDVIMIIHARKAQFIEWTLWNKKWMQPALGFIYWIVRHIIYR